VRREQDLANLRTIEAEIERLVAVLGAGGDDLPSVVRAVRAKEASRRELLDAIAAASGSETRPVVSVDRLADELRGLLRHWRRVLRHQAPDTRPMLRRLLAEPVLFTPEVSDERRLYRFVGHSSVGHLLAGSIQLRWRP
jgi:hypothetical protein